MLPSTLQIGFLRTLTICLFALLLSASLPTLAAPKADLWSFWEAHKADSPQSIDHSSWNILLKNKTKIGAQGVRLVGYSSFTPAERKALQGYIAGLSALTIADYSRAEQKAYWINLYNALTVEVILDHYPVKSITKVNISPGLFSFGPWDKKLLTIMGQEVSLNDIEHRILRPIWKDLRIHYAVNCASISCPNLAGLAYTAANTESLLEQGAREYVNNPRGIKVLKDGELLLLSSIYDWYQVDFGDNEARLLEHLRKYAKPSLLPTLEGKPNIDYDYDWNLNEYK